MGTLSLRPFFAGGLVAVPTVTVNLALVRSYVDNTTPNKVNIEFTRPVTITDLTGISLSFTIGIAKTILSVSGSGTDMLVFTLNDNVAYGDLFNIVFGGTNNIIDSESNSLSAITSTVNATDVQQVSITSEADLQHWFNLEDNSLVFKSDGTYAGDGEDIYNVFDAKDPFNLKLGNYETGLNVPAYDTTLGAAFLDAAGWLQTYLDHFNGGNGGSSTYLTDNAGDFHYFLKLVQVGTNNIQAYSSRTVNRGLQLNGSTGVAQMWSSLGTTRTFPTSSTKIGDGNNLMLEIVRYDSGVSNTIEVFVTDGTSRESLGTVSDSGTFPGSGQTFNRRLTIIGSYKLQQVRAYGSDQRSNYAAIHSDLNF